jgi:hypothetical protein
MVFGGAEAWQLALARSCDPARVEFVGCNVMGGEVATDPGMVAETRKLMPVSFGPGAARDLAERADVLVMWAIGGGADLLRGMEDPPKVVEVCHAPKESPWAMDIYGRSTGIDRWVAVSELAVEAISRVSRDGPPVSVIWNAVDPSRLEVRRDRAGMRRLWGIPEGAKVAGYLGRLSEEKDPHAMRRMIGHLPEEWHAVLVGAGAERVEPHPRLHLVGPDPNAGDVLNAFDVLFVPSAYESFGLTIAEGLWLDKPLVTTDTGLTKLARSVEVPGLNPGCSFSMTVPILADGPTLADAAINVLDEDWHSGYPARIREMVRRAILPRIAPGRFGREWTDLITSMVDPMSWEARVSEGRRQVRLSVLRNKCPHARPLREHCHCDDFLCADRGGERVTREACYRCLEEAGPFTSAARVESA